MIPPMPAPTGPQGSTSDRLDWFAAWRCGLDDPAVELDLTLSRITGPQREALAPALDHALACGRPVVLDVVVYPNVPRLL